MSDFTVKLQVPVYLQQWMYNAFGNPVELLRDGPESRLLNELLRKQPYGNEEETPETIKEEPEEILVEVKVKIPWFKTKDARVYNFLSAHGETAMVDSFKTMFKKDLLNSIGTLKNLNCKQTTLIYDFMDNHGIDENNWDTVKQIYYRNKKSYLKKNNIKI